MNKVKRAPVTPQGATDPSARLTKAALRLLSALAEPGAAARRDPTRDGMLLVRTSRAGVSLGTGAHGEAAGDDLLRLDLARRSGPKAADLTITEAGEAHLRRRAADGDLSTPFQAQQLDLVAREVEAEDGTTSRVTANAGESPLDWLVRRRGRDGRPLIDAASYGAGERLRRDLTIGGVLPSVTARWESHGGGAGGAMRDPAGATDAMIAARQRVSAAMSAVGADMSGLLIDLCGFLKGLELIERERGWPPRSGKVVAKLALGRLAEHYGLDAVARGPASSHGIRTWQTDPQVGPAERASA